MSTRSKWLDWKPGVAQEAPIFLEHACTEPTKPSKPGFVGFVGGPQARSQKIEAEPKPHVDGGESNTRECIGVPEPPDNDWDGHELELISSIKDGSVRDEVIAFKNILGGTLSLAGKPGKFVSADQYQKDMLDGLFAKHRKLQEQQYAGLTLEKKEDLARRAAVDEKDSRKARPHRKCA